MLQWFRNSQDTYIAGVDVNVAKRTSVSYDQFYVLYKGDSPYSLVGADYRLVGWHSGFARCEYTGDDYLWFWGEQERGSRQWCGQPVLQSDDRAEPGGANADDVSDRAVTFQFSLLG